MSPEDNQPFPFKEVAHLVEFQVTITGRPRLNFSEDNLKDLHDCYLTSKNGEEFVSLLGETNSYFDTRFKSSKAKPDWADEECWVLKMNRVYRLVDPSPCDIENTKNSYLDQCDEFIEFLYSTLETASIHNPSGTRVCSAEVDYMLIESTGKPWDYECADDLEVLEFPETKVWRNPEWIKV